MGPGAALRVTIKVAQQLRPDRADRGLRTLTTGRWLSGDPTQLIAADVRAPAERDLQGLRLRSRIRTIGIIVCLVRHTCMRPLPG
jgi:hypothetical protein